MVIPPDVARRLVDSLPGGVLELFSGCAIDMVNEPTAHGARKVAELHQDASGAWSGTAFASGDYPVYFGRVIENGVAVTALGIDIVNGIDAGQIVEVKLSAASGGETRTQADPPSLAPEAWWQNAYTAPRSTFPAGGGGSGSASYFDLGPPPHGEVRRTITLTEYVDGTIERVEVDAHGAEVEHGTIASTIPTSVLPFAYALEGRS